MRFLLDEMYTQDIAAGCRARGVDVVSVHERPELEGEPDDAEVLRAASRERRVLVTNNHRDLVPIVERFAEAGEEHYGVLLTSDKSRATRAFRARPRPLASSSGRSWTMRPGPLMTTS